jgi:hypothetical protein
MVEKNAGRPLAITILAGLLFLCALFAFLGSLFMWGEGFLLEFPEGVDYAFPVTDILVNAPASIVAAVGLWRLKRYGYLASYFVAGFYLYAQVYICVDVIAGNLPFTPEIVAPVLLAVLVAVGLLIYPARFRERFRPGVEAVAGRKPSAGLLIEGAAVEDEAGSRQAGALGLALRGQRGHSEHPRAGSDADRPATYHIRVRGRLDQSWSDWFDGMTVEVESQEDGLPVTTLTGVVLDQAALHGLLNRIRDLDLPLLAVRRPAA